MILKNDDILFANPDDIEKWWYLIANEEDIGKW